MPLRYAFERLRATFRRARFDQDLDAELEAHAALLQERYIRGGHTPEEASRLVRIELGDRAALREAHAAVRSLSWIDDARCDILHAFRSLRRDSGFAFFVLLVGSLGIGASTAVFSIVNALLIRQLPVHDPSTLAWLANNTRGATDDRSTQTVPVNPFVEFRAGNRSFSDMAAFFAFYEPGGITMTGAGEPERLTGIPVSDNFFRVLGVAPKLGREMTAEECGSFLPVVVLSEGFWRRRFSSDPGIVGQALTINNRAVTVVGVMPVDFGSVFAPGTRVDLFTPLPLTSQVNSIGNSLAMIGRLRPGITIRDAQAEADVLTGPIGARNNRTDLRFSVRSLDDYVRGAVRPILLLLAGAVGVVMLVLCANVSHLQLARAAARSREMSIRVALGAGHGRLIKQLLTESLLLVGASAAFGLVLAYGMTRLIAGLDSIHLPLREGVRIDGLAFAFSGLLAVATAILCGLAPAMQLPRDVHNVMKESSQAVSAGRRYGWVRRALVVSEIALASVLLVGSGLLFRSLQKLLDVRLGFQPAQLAALRIDPAAPNGAARNSYFDDALGRVRALTGITAAGITDVIPLGGNRSWGVGAREQTYSEGHPPPDAFVRIVSDGYLSAMGIPLRSGRDIDSHDREGSAPVVLVNETLARTLWPGEDPLGKMVKYVGNKERQVVGVVADVRHIALEQASGNEIYVPIRQTADYSAVHIVFRSSINPSAAVTAVRQALRPLDPNIPVNAHRIVSDLVDEAIAPRRMTTVLLAGFAVFTLILAAMGIFGLISYSVSQQEPEISIRMALGATRWHIQAAVLRETLMLAAAGLGTGLAASLAFSLALDSLLFGVGKTDPVTLAVVFGVIGGIAVLAGFLPARRASRTSPVQSLRGS